MKKLTSILLFAALLLSLSAGALADGAEVSVSDAYTFVSETGEEYHIPQIDLPGPGVAALNAAMWHDLYEGYMYDVQYAAESGEWSGIMSISYSWITAGDVLSILAVVRYDANDLCDYYVYNMSISAGERLSDRELFQAAGVDREQFNDLMRDAVNVWFDALPPMPDDGGFSAAQRENSLADDSIARAMPYLGPNGSLCAVGLIYPIAGAERYMETFTLITTH